MHITSYDDTVISTHARRLYRRSGLVEGVYILCGAGLFGLEALILGAAATLVPVALGAVALAAATLGGLLGWALGLDRALAMRCQAQIALAQVQIELNTRLAVFHLTVRPTSLPEAAAGSGPHRAALARAG